MKISFAELSSLPKAETLVLLVGDDKKLTGLAQEADKKSGGQIGKAIAASKFAGKKGQYLAIPAPAGLSVSRLILAGAGAAKDFNALTAQGIGGGLIAQVNGAGLKSATIALEAPKGAKFPAAEAAAYVAYGALLKSYRFDKYKTKMKAEDKPTFATLAVNVAKSKDAQKQFARLEPVANAVFFTRDLVSEPANIIYPESLAAECKKLAKLGVQVNILGEKEMKKLGMGALLGVGQGSIRESQLVTMQWKGATGTPIAFVGKGVTFDTGGISIKPANGMEEMKWDMGGAGAVIGLMHALASRKAKANVVGVVGLVENMPGSNAQRPGDVVTSMSGQTIEVLNTDAEGRLVLSDALWYAQEKFKPNLVIDLATLTGAVIVALGSSRAGLFANDDTLAEHLFTAGQESGEELWRLPLGDVYDKQINSDIADMQNIGADREAGSTMGAVFLQRYIQDGVKWAHLDIAGTAWTKKESDTNPKGATAYGVRLLDHYVAKHHEK